VDDQHPWLGLDAFTEELSDYFYGRTDEAEELFRRVKRESLTVLFGTSGLGKTSLLRAGLFPALRAEGFLPVYIRLDHEPTASAFILQVKAALTEAIMAARISQPTLPESDETLWEFFHRDSLHLQTWNGQPITPVLVIDQFEELFTIGTRDEAIRQNYEMLFTELSDLVENHPPARVRERLRSNPEQVANLGFGPAHVRVLFSLREDYLANLEACYELIPSISRNRMRLTLMNGQQALDAVILPGAELVSREVGEQIVRFVAAAGQRQLRTDNAGSRQHGLLELDVEPALLSLFCSELNGQRIAQGLSQITADLVEKSSEQILENFYEGCFADQAAGARVFVEEELLTSDGYRDDMEFKRAKEELSEHGAAATSLDELIKYRLLHRTRRGETLRVELTHDVLTGVVRDSRDKRRLREAREEAEAKQREAEAMLLRRAEAERKAKEDAEASAREAAERAAILDEALQKETQARKEADLATRRARWLAVAAVVVALVAVAAFAAALAARAAAQTAKERAVASKKAANELINFMQYDLSKRLGTLGRLDMMNAINTRIMKYHEDHPPEAGDLDAIRERSVALTQQGDVQSAQGDLAGALKSYRDSLGIAEKLAKQDPDNAGWQHDLAWSFRRVGQTLESQGKLTEALTAFQNFKETFERLTAKDSSNTGWQWNLAVGYSDIGDILKAQGNLTEALVVYEQFKDRMERLAKQDPGNAEWQSDLAWVSWQTGSAWADVEPKSKNEAQAMVEKGRDILRQLKARTGLTANQQEWLDSIEADLRKMEEKE
jgi:tetratricopeptide (TPR) repeat protein